jgi:hypothetical protein
MVMSIRNILLAAALPLAFLGAAHADDVRPIEGKDIHLGNVSGVANYTVERDGFHVIITLAQGEAGTPVRMVAVLAPGQRVVLSTPQEANQNATTVEISRQADTVLVRDLAAVR